MSSHPKHGLVEADDDASSARVSTVCQPAPVGRCRSTFYPDLSGETVTWIVGQLPAVSEDAMRDESTSTRTPAATGSDPAARHPPTAARVTRYAPLYCGPSEN